jgi:hypothetical protein
MTNDSEASLTNGFSINMLAVNSTSSSMTNDSLASLPNDYLFKILPCPDFSLQNHPSF